MEGMDGVESDVFPEHGVWKSQNGNEVIIYILHETSAWDPIYSRPMWQLGKWERDSVSREH